MNEIIDFNNALEQAQKTICEKLKNIVEKYLENAEARIYHGSPVWFINDNPIVGYSIKKAGVALLFWSGSSFTNPGLLPIGKHKAAEIVYRNCSEIQEERVRKWINESSEIIWDYKNIVRNKGELKLLE